MAGIAAFAGEGEERFFEPGAGNLDVAGPGEGGEQSADRGVGILAAQADGFAVTLGRRNRLQAGRPGADWIDVGQRRAERPPAYSAP